MSVSKEGIGFIGLGLMGQAFTRRLVERGYQVTGYDIAADKVRAAEEHGVRPAASPAEVAQASGVVLVCVTSTQDVGQVLFGAGGVAEAAVRDKVVVDHSTSEVEATRTMAARLRSETGMGLVDAPVSGGPPAAAAGTLAIMAGGDAADIARVAPVMADLGALTHMGPVGAGQTTKMVNQILVLNNYCVLAEALALAEAGGVDASKIPDALASGHAGSNILKALFPRMIRRDFAPTGYARQVLKDLDMVQSLARDLKVPTPISAQAASLFRIMVAKGHAELDGIAVLKLYDGKDHV
jgi:3-hydroxyisobutyrate dehydrogenase-like beta-hydroxyacid dehydrogenase